MDDEEFEIEEDDSSYDTNKTTGEKLRDLYNENKKLIIIVGVVLLLLIILSIATKSSGPKVKISETEKTITTESGVQLKLLVDELILKILICNFMVFIYSWLILYLTCAKSLSNRNVAISS